MIHVSGVQKLNASDFQGLVGGGVGGASAAAEVGEEQHNALVGRVIADALATESPTLVTDAFLKGLGAHAEPSSQLATFAAEGGSAELNFIAHFPMGHFEISHLIAAPTI